MNVYNPCYGSCNCRCNCYRPCCHRPCMNHSQGASAIEGDFYESTVLLQVPSGESFTDVFPTHNARAVTMFAKNTGENPVTIFLQNSPNGLDFVDDPQRLELAAGKTGYLVPYIFSKYTRAVAQSTQEASVRLWTQIQNHSYLQHPL